MKCVFISFLDEAVADANAANATDDEDDDKDGDNGNGGDDGGSDNGHIDPALGDKDLEHGNADKFPSVVRVGNLLDPLLGSLSDSLRSSFLLVCYKVFIEVD